MLLSCIIPAYNEHDRLPQVLDELMQISHITEIICVDDGSATPIPLSVQKNYPHVTFLRHPTNKGKAAAVKTGLASIRGDVVLLIDADLVGLSAADLVRGIEKFSHDPSLDMLVFRSTHPYVLTRMSRHDILFSGIRLLHTADLRAVFRTYKPHRYALEVAINTYLMHQQKKVCFLGYAAKNTLKTEKIGFISGIQENMKMLQNIWSFAGVPNYLKQILFWGHEEVR